MYVQISLVVRVTREVSQVTLGFLLFMLPMGSLASLQNTHANPGLAALSLSLCFSVCVWLRGLERLIMGVNPNWKG